VLNTPPTLRQYYECFDVKATPLVLGHCQSHVLAQRLPWLLVPGNASREALSLVILIHSYHLLFFDIAKITFSDLVHHFASVFAVGGITCVFPFGGALGAVTLFKCGLPGGIDYALLGLVKHGVVEFVTGVKRALILFFLFFFFIGTKFRLIVVFFFGLAGGVRPTCGMRF
jgi:hypothetical protein